MSERVDHLMTGRRLLNRRGIGWGAGAAAIVLLAMASVSWWVAGQLISPAPRMVGGRPANIDVESVLIPSDSGSMLGGWYVLGTAEKGSVVLLHSNRSSRLQMVDRARLLNRHGYTTLMIDLQAHGESPGKHITAGYLERCDAQAAVRYVRERRPRRPIAVVGVSLGGAATLLASPLDIDAAVLESVYPTIGEAIDNRIRMKLGTLSPLATQLLLTQLRLRLGISADQLRPIDHIGEIGCPVLVVAGNLDRHTSLADTRRLFQAASEPRQLAIIDGAAHVDLYGFDPVVYADLVLEFLESHLKTQ